MQRLQNSNKGYLRSGFTIVEPNATLQNAVREESHIISTACDHTQLSTELAEPARCPNIAYPNFACPREE